MAIVKVNGQSIDDSDPCALLAALRLVRIKIAAGENVEETSIKSALTSETVRFSPANLPALDAEIKRLTLLCEGRRGPLYPTKGW